MAVHNKACPMERYVELYGPVNAPECACDTAELAAQNAVAEYRMNLARKYEEYRKVETAEWEKDTFQTEWGEGVHNATISIYDGIIRALLGMTYTEYKEYRRTGEDNLFAAVRRTETTVEGKQ